MKVVSLRRNFLWSFVGNTAYNVVQWLLLVVLARVGNPTLVGEFAAMLAITAPIYMTLGLNLRVVRATDVRRVWSSGQYYRLRGVLNVVSLLVAMLVGVLFGLRGDVLLALFILAMGKSVEATSLMIYGYFQCRERLDLVARSLLLRAATGAGGFVVLLTVTRRLEAAVLGLLLGWSAVWLLHDRPQERLLLQNDVEAARIDGVEVAGGGTLTSLARQAAPLGIDAGVNSLSTNVPRYAVQLALGTAQLGAFVTLAYAAQIVSTVTGTLGDTVVGRLAKHVERGDSAAFVSLLAKLVAFGLVVALVGSVTAWSLGDWAIRLVLGDDYVNRPVLVILMLGAAAITVQRSLARGLQAALKFRQVLAVDVVILVATVVLSLALVPSFGLVGAAATLGLGYLTGIGLSMALLARVVTEVRAKPQSMVVR